MVNKDEYITQNITYSNRVRNEPLKEEDIPCFIDPSRASNSMQLLLALLVRRKHAHNGQCKQLLLPTSSMQPSYTPQGMTNSQWRIWDNHYPGRSRNCACWRAPFRSIEKRKTLQILTLLDRLGAYGLNEYTSLMLSLLLLTIFVQIIRLTYFRYSW